MKRYPFHRSQEGLFASPGAVIPWPGAVIPWPPLGAIIIMMPSNPM
ncbi:MAG: hypothetical protein IIC64_16725 [SAR324 cluster bacterium]|nr:hypothetical protein [SAR324 cluster bacterium]